MKVKVIEDNLKKPLLLFALFMTLVIPMGLWAQQVGYSQTNLVSNTAGVANTTDTQLLNPWRISILPGQDFWIANNNSGTSTLYDAQGNKDTALVVTIPGAAHNPNGNCSPGCPTGTVSDGNGTYFGSGGQFIFDTEDGIVANWTGASNTATVAFDNSASGAVYKSLALLNSDSHADGQELPGLEGRDGTHQVGNASHTRGNLARPDLLHSWAANDGCSGAPNPQ